MVREDLPMSRGRYRDQFILSGAADIDGKRVVVAGVRPSDTRFSVGISLRPGTEPVIIELEVSPGKERE